MKKKLLFYCQHVLGIGHYIRSRAIVQALADFDVCFVNGGEIVAGLEMPPEVEVVNLIALKTDANFRQLRLSDNDLDLDEVKPLMIAYSRMLL
jgi:predicted glycosyltransferase